MDERKVELTMEQLKQLRDGLCVWNTIILNSLTERGRTKLYIAQNLAERLWKENA